MLNASFITDAIKGFVAPKIPSLPNTQTAGGVYMAKLGAYMFSLETAAFQQLQRSTEYRWALINRFGRTPAAHFTGMGEDTIELSGAIYPHFRGGLRQMGQMRDAAAKGEALPLIYGFDSVGQYCGLWAIRSIREARTVFMRDGRPKKIEFTISLVYYGEDAGKAKAVVTPITASIPGGMALPVPALGGSAVGNLLGSAMKMAGLPNISNLSSMANIGSIASAVSGVANAAAGIANNAKALMSGSFSSLSTGALALLPPGVTGAVGDLAKTASMVLDARDEVKAAVAVFSGSPVGLKSTTAGLMGTMSNVMKQASASGGVVKSAASSMSYAGPRPGVSNSDRLSAAAALANIARASDHIVFAAAESGRQAGVIHGKIDG